MKFQAPDLKSQAFSNLIFNFELYYTCEKSLQMKLLTTIEDFLLKNDDLSSISPQQSLFYLFYSLNEFYPLEYHIKILENHQDSQSILQSLNDLLEIRREIFKLIEKFVQFYEDSSLLIDFLNLVFQNLLSNRDNIAFSSFELLQIVKKFILKKKDKSNKKLLFKLNLPESPIAKPANVFSMRKIDKSPQNLLKTNKSDREMLDFDKSSKSKTKSINYLLFNEILLQILIFLLDKEKRSEFFRIRNLILQKSSENDDFDEFLSLLLHLLFNFLIKDDKKGPQKSYSHFPVSNPSISLNMEKSSEGKSHKKPKIQLNSIKILETLDTLLPEILPPKSFRRLLSILAFSFEQNMNYESLLLPIIWKRSDFSIFPIFMTKFHSIQKTNDEAFFRILVEIPNFMVFLSSFKDKIIGISKDSDSGIGFETFLNKFLFFLFFQENGLKFLKLFIFNARNQLFIAIEQVLNVACIIIDEFFIENQEFIDKTRQNPENSLIFPEKTQKMLKNMVYFSYLISNLDFLDFKAQIQVFYGFIEKSFDLFEKIHILHSTFPEIQAQKEELDFSHLWEYIMKEIIKEELHLRKGGVFYNFIYILFEILNNSLGKAHFQYQRLQILNLLSKMVFPLRKKQKKLLEISNRNFKKLFNFVENFNVEKKENGTFTSRLSKSQIYDIFLYKLLETIENQIFLSSEPDEKILIELMLFLKEIIETSGTDYTSKLTNQAFTGFRSQISPINMFSMNKSQKNDNIIENSPHESMDFMGKSLFQSENHNLKKDFLKFGAIYNQEYMFLMKKNKIFQGNMMFSGGQESPISDETEKYVFHSKSLEQTPQFKIEFFMILKEILAKNYSDMQKTLNSFIEEFQKARDEIIKIIRPIFAFLCYQGLYFIEKMERFKLNLYLDLNQRENTRVPMNFQLNLGIEEDYRRMFEKDAFRFKARFLHRSERKRILINKHLFFNRI